MAKTKRAAKGSKTKRKGRAGKPPRMSMGEMEMAINHSEDIRRVRWGASRSDGGRRYYEADGVTPIE